MNKKIVFVGGLVSLIFFASIFYSFENKTIADNVGEIENATIQIAPLIAEELVEEIKTVQYIATTKPSIPSKPSKPSIPTVIASVPESVSTVEQVELYDGSVGTPVRLIIPSINVNAYVEQIGLTPEGAVGVPAGGKNVSWFDVGPRPGEQGSAVISGHYGIWKGGSNSVFNYLSTLTPGDEIMVKDDESNIIKFIVSELRIYGKDEIVPDIFKKTDGIYLNIITCHGEYLSNQQTYSQRLVVFSKKLN